MNTSANSVCNFVSEVMDSESWLNDDDGILLSVVIPAYNEQTRLPRTLQLLHKLPDSHRLEVIVVCDGCTDQTEVIALQWANKLRLKAISYPHNRGKGYAVRRGILASSGAIVAYLDADGATPPDELLRLQKPIQNGDADVVIGSRRVNGAIVHKQPLLRHWSGKIFPFLTRLILGLPYADTQCGCKLFRRDIALELFEPLCCWGFAFDLEILSIAAASRASIHEMGITWKDQPGSKVHLLRDGFKMVRSLLLIRLLTLLRPHTALVQRQFVAAKAC